MVDFATISLGSPGAAVMRFVTFQSKDTVRPGLLLSDSTVLDLRRAIECGGATGLIPANRQLDPGHVPHDLTGFIALGDQFAELASLLRDRGNDPALAPAQVPAASVTLLAPLHRPRKNVFCVGSNYRAHVTESTRAQKLKDKTPDYPVFFTKPATAVVGNDASVRLDRAVSEKIDYEVELGVVFGKAGRNIPAARAEQHIYGFTIINDITARDIQRRHGGQFLKGKGLDTCCPMGPCLVTADELPAYDNLAIRLWVNGELRQDGNTRDMIFSVPQLVESLSEGMTLEPGDILATGTPSGVGYAMDPPRFLRHGDKVTCEIEGVGMLTNTIADTALAAASAA